MAKAEHIEGLQPAMPVDEALDRVVSVRLDELRGYLKGVRGDGDVDAVHDARVTVRRLRAALRALGARAALTEADRQASALQDALGELRDLQLRVQWLEEEGSTASLAKRERQALPERVEAARQAVAGWRKQGLPTLREAMQAHQDERVLARVARKRLDRHRRRVRKAERALEKTPEAETFHRLRIALKKLRYEVEVWQVAAPKETRSLLGHMAHLQSLLGDLHDVDVHLEWLSDGAGDEAVAPVIEEARRQQRKLRRKAEKALDEAGTPKRLKKLARRLEKRAS